MNDDRLKKISLSTVKGLIVNQFPDWSNLSIKPVRQSGWDNHTFRLGEDKLIRLPSASRYEAQVEKEQEWLPKLSRQLNYAIPKPLEIGRPSKFYPWKWSIYEWIEGSSLNFLTNKEFQKLAYQVGNCLRELHELPASNGPEPGEHNFFRGGDLSHYDFETNQALDKLNGMIDIRSAREVWKQALRTKWTNTPIWVHGDYSEGNILNKDGKVSAVIDFGSLGVGDPACDLVLYWTGFDKGAKSDFKDCFDFDDDTWDRARGWALWKAVITLVGVKDSDSKRVADLQDLIFKLTCE